MKDNAWDNPFNVEAAFMKIDPLYAVTAEDADMRCFSNHPVTTGLDTYVEAKWLIAYQKAIREAIEEGRVPLKRKTAEVPSPAGATVTDCVLKRIETYRMEEAEPGLFYIDAVLAVEIDIFQPADPKVRTLRLGSYRALLSIEHPFEEGSCPAVVPDQRVYGSGGAEYRDCPEHHDL